VGAELFYADRQTDRRDEGYSRFLQFCEGCVDCIVVFCSVICYVITNTTGFLVLEFWALGLYECVQLSCVYVVWQKSNETGNAVHEPKTLLPPPSHGS